MDLPAENTAAEVDRVRAEQRERSERLLGPLQDDLYRRLQRVGVDLDPLRHGSWGRFTGRGDRDDIFRIASQDFVIEVLVRPLIGGSPIE